MALVVILFCWFTDVAPKEFLGHFTVFALSCVVGYVVWNVSHALHTPLMSYPAFCITVVGALLQIGQGGWVSFLSLSRYLLPALIFSVASP